MFGLTTSTSIDADTPLKVVAVMVAVPFATAVMSPLLLTLATLESLDFHVTGVYFGSALEGAIVVLICTVFPASKVTASLFKVRESTFTPAAFTVTVASAVSPFLVVAVMIAVPSPFAVTLPLSLTTATEVLLDVHVGFLLVTLLGVMVAVNLTESPRSKLAVVLSSVIPVASTTVTSSSFQPHM